MDGLLESKLELPEPQLSENAVAVLEKRYFKRDKDGKVDEDPKQLFWRVALNIASAGGSGSRPSNEGDVPGFPWGPSGSA
jgi:hypothetical protein